VNSKRINTTLLIILIIGIVGCALTLIPQVRSLIITFGEQVIVHRTINHEKWHNRLFNVSIVCIILFIVLLPISRKFPHIIIIGSIMIRLINISNPLLDRHGFRQTQTAITVQTYINEGLSVFNYQTPVLGEPWTLPMEFPTFQMSAYFLYKFAALFVSPNLDIIMRVTGLFYFYLAGIFVYLVGLQIFEKKRIAKLSVFLYLFLPYGIFWGRTSMIEFAACMGGLGYVYFFTKLIKGDIKSIIPAIFFGVFGYLTKIPTMLPFCVFLAYVIMRHLTNNNFKSVKYFFSRQTIYVLLRIFATTVIPLVVGILWVKYADFVKDISGHGWLDSKSLKNWNFGTLGQKLDLSNWMRILKYIVNILPVGSIVTCLISIPMYLRNRKEKLKNVIVLFLSCFITIFVFFNLYYVHDYYFCAVFPFMCLALSDMLYNTAKPYLTKFTVKQSDVIKKYYLLLLIIIMLFGSTLVYIKDVFRDKKSPESSFFQLTEYIKNNTLRDDLIMVFDNDWSSEIPYYANRKAFMVATWLEEKAYKSSVAYTIFVMTRAESNQERLARLPETVFEISIGDWDVYRKKE
jgi:hypothetical protein